MKFKKEMAECNRCYEYYDAFIARCPSCGKRNPMAISAPGSKKMFWMDPLKQLYVFLLGFIGFNVFSAIVSLIITFTVKGIYEPDIANAILASNEIIMVLNSACYLLVLIGFVILLYPYLNDLFKSFLKYKNVLMGIGFGVALILTSFLYGVLINLIPGLKDTPSNSNQSRVVECVLGFPFAAILLFGIAGPFTEEVTYRLGCFTGLNRFNRIVAYIVTTLIFAFIHFDFTAGSRDAYIIELINIPSYIIAAILLCVAYEQGGFACSVTAHIINNLYSIFNVLILSIIM